MKTIKSILTLVALVAVFSTTAIAQVEVTATATVYSTLSLDFTGTGGADVITFGGLLKGNYTATVQSNGTGHENVGQSAAPATGTLEADNGADIYISYSSSVVMKNSNDDQLTLTPTLTVGSEAISSGGGTYTMVGETAEVVVGGSITLATNTPDGTYTNDDDPIVITFNYN